MPRSPKPRPALHASKRERVVIAASRLFLRDGYGSTGMDAIAREADVSKATLYSYYEDKAALFADVITRTCEELGGPPQAESYFDEPPAAGLRAIAMRGLHKVLETVHRQILARVVAESGEFPELGRKFWEHGPGRFELVLARYLAEAKRRNLLDVPDPERAAARLAGQITGLYLLPILAGVRGRPSEAEIRRDVDEVIAGFLAKVSHDRSSGRRNRR
jgi:TetR/AcrR family transcriptional regulator, mexJK operon transcriptional repressor